MRVLLVTSDQDHCGIREYGRLLMECTSPETTDTYIEEFPHTHPDSLFAFLDCPRKYDVVHLNHHAALHSAWKPEHLAKLQELGYAVVVTQHDTFENFSTMQERGFPDFRGADVLVLHEEVLAFHEKNVRVLRQGIPSYALDSRAITPTLGLCGFDFPWKGFDAACRIAERAGWAVRLVSPNLTVERAAVLQEIADGHLELFTGWRSAERVVQALSACWATAFLYSCGNSGTSGAIRLGVAAHRPVLAYGACRQFRDLRGTWPGEWAISWVEDELQAEMELRRLESSYTYHQARVLSVDYLAGVDSWSAQAHYYREAYRAAALARARRNR